MASEPRAERGTEGTVHRNGAGGRDARVNAHRARATERRLCGLVRRLVRIRCGAAFRAEVTTEGKRPVFEGNNVVEESGVVARQTHDVAVGNGTEPAVLLEGRVQLGVCGDE